MKRNTVVFCSWISALILFVGSALARPARQVHEVSEPEVEIDIVGDVDGTNSAPQKALQDTVWIADWAYDGGTPCSEAGWTHVDNHILNDGVEYWHMETGFSSAAGIAGNSWALGYHDNHCCVATDGYDNDWYQALRLTYTGNANISLDYMVDSEAGFDYFQVETDSLCLSSARVDFDVNPNANAATFRTVEMSADGLNTNGEWNNQPLSNYGAGTHCCYIAFFSDFGFSPCDGDQPTTIGEAAVVDNIVLVDSGGTKTEDFEDGDLDFGWTEVNLQDDVPFGTWARLYEHITDNDLCTENRTCAWLWTDYTTPTLFNDPSMSFGPGGYVIRNWLDDIIVAPWVSLVSTPTATGTVLEFRRFPGNFFSTGRIVQNWSVRGKGTIDGQACVTGWGHASSWNSLSFFGWQTLRFNMTPNFDPSAEAIQIRYRTSDWQWIAQSGAPGPFVPGPGPYVDRTRIGRLVLSGPVINEGIDARSQGQDCFPTEISPLVTPAGEHHRPTTDRFATCAFTQGTELAIGRRSRNLITGDSIHVSVSAVRPGGTVVTSVTWSGAIITGPHVGKAPAPYTVGANGFFSFAADTVGSASGGVLANNYFVDLDDTYFRGGDVLVYLWAATDNAGGYTSDPVGLTAPPVSVAAAQTATRGLFEVNFLPQINWSASYLARVQADAHGDLEPTAGELSVSAQRNCILYIQNIASRRMSGQLNRTSFMYALDHLGYHNPTTGALFYDVYDHQGMGNTNNQLGGRATIQQCQGYNLIVYDNGNGTPGRPLLPDGVDLDASKIDQAGWFRNWLAQAPISTAGFATLWMIGSNTVQEKATNSLITNNMGVTLTATDQGLNVNPNVDGQVSFTFDQGPGSAIVDFAPDLYALNGGCPVVRNYDAIDAQGGTAVRTHRYRSPTTGALGPGAVVMNRNNAEAWNTIQMTHPWSDIRDNAGTPANYPPEFVLLTKILGAVLPPQCLRMPYTDTDPGDELAVPLTTALHQNVPNPFNPTTQIRFDLAQGGKVSLRIYDVAGRLVRTLIDEAMTAGRNHVVVWNGLDDQNNQVASGVYFYSLEAPGAHLTRKMVVMK